MGRPRPDDIAMMRRKTRQKKMGTPNKKTNEFGTLNSSITLTGTPSEKVRNE